MDAVFKSHIEIINALLCDVKENPSTCAADTAELNFFWIKICLAVQQISKDATNLCMGFSKPPPPPPNESDAMLKKLESDTVALVSTFYSLALSFGLTLKKKIHEAVFDIVRAVLNLVTSIQTNQYTNSQDQRQKTGSVWECCDEFSKLPRDNCSAVLAVIRQSQSLVNDALQEIEEARAEENAGFDDFTDEDNATWSESDKLILDPALAIVKASKACLKKSAGVVKNAACPDLTQETVANLDEIAEYARKLSPVVDDLSASLYPPVQNEVVKENAQNLATVVKNFLEYLRSCSLTQNTDETWINFLTQATDHNFDKLCTQISSVN